MSQKVHDQTALPRCPLVHARESRAMRDVIVVAGAALPTAEPDE